MNVITKKFCFILLILFITTVNFAQVTTTISASSNWTDVLLLKSLKPSEAYMATTNYNTYPRLAATAWTHSGAQITYRSLLKFDLAFIPAGTTVISAVLYLNSDPAYASGELSNQYSNSIYFQKVTQSFNCIKISSPNLTYQHNILTL